MQFLAELAHFKKSNLVFLKGEVFEISFPNIT